MNRTFLASIALLSAIFASHINASPIDNLLQEQAITECRQGISDLAAEVIKTNPHRFHRADKSPQLFSAIAVVQYRDRNSHLSIHAKINTQQQCEYSVTETFVVPHPCITAREEVFKKWDYLGKMSDDTMVLKSKKQPEKLAYLSNAVDGAICMISTKFSR